MKKEGDRKNSEREREREGEREKGEEDRESGEGRRILITGNAPFPNMIC